MGTSTMTQIVRSDSLAICEVYESALKLPHAQPELQVLAEVFEGIAEVLNCVGLIDGSHVRFNNCLSS